MDKIQEEFDLWQVEYCINSCKQKTDNCIVNTCLHQFNYVDFSAGFKAADLLPTEKPCPACNGHGLLPITLSGELSSKPDRKCPKCKNGTIPLYYTPEQYEEIMGKPYPDDVLVRCKLYSGEWGIGIYKNYKKADHVIVIVQTAQSAPAADYRPEEKRC